MVLPDSLAHSRAAARVWRYAGVLIAASTVALWTAYLFKNPYAPAAGGRVLTFGSLMILSAVLSAVAAGVGAHLGMYLLFVVSFFPVGLYVLLGPGVFQAIGWLNLMYLGCAVLVHRAFRAATDTRPV